MPPASLSARGVDGVGAVLLVVVVGGVVLHRMRSRSTSRAGRPLPIVLAAAAARGHTGDGVANSDVVPSGDGLRAAARGGAPELAGEPVRRRRRRRSLADHRRSTRRRRPTVAYERAAIARWLQNHDTAPARSSATMLSPAALRRSLQAFVAANPAPSTEPSYTEEVRESSYGP